jgi:hypothetical protein
MVLPSLCWEMHQLVSGNLFETYWHALEITAIGSLGRLRSVPDSFPYAIEAKTQHLWPCERDD